MEIAFALVGWLIAGGLLWDRKRITNYYYDLVGIWEERVGKLNKESSELVSQLYDAQALASKAENDLRDFYESTQEKAQSALRELERSISVAQVCKVYLKEMAGDGAILKDSNHINPGFLEMLQEKMTGFSEQEIRQALKSVLDQSSKSDTLDDSDPMFEVREETKIDGGTGGW